MLSPLIVSSYPQKLGACLQTVQRSELCSNPESHNWPWQPWMIRSHLVIKATGHRLHPSPWSFNLFGYLNVLASCSYSSSSPPTKIIKNPTNLDRSSQKKHQASNPSRNPRKVRNAAVCTYTMAKKDQ